MSVFQTNGVKGGVMSNPSLVLHFPTMHPELWPGDSVPGARFLDPGMADESPECYRLPNLPLTGAAASRALEELMGFGSNFKRPSDLAFYLASPDKPAVRVETTRQLTREILQRTAGEPAPPAPDGEPSDHQTLIRAQLALLLAYGQEINRLETRSLQRKVAEGFSGFDLGLSGPDEGREDSEDALERTVVATGKTLSNLTIEEDETPTDWAAVLSAVWAFAPAGTQLAAADEEILRELVDAGFEQIEPGRIRGAGSLAPKAKYFPGPWLDKILEIVLADAKKGESG
jgi:hypothetical protein